ncbi:MAG: DUF11 domain-containing protein [Planctomycetes bacterium]|nr:DUF11 domain-containing protein [Planctomycetota bacterium]
MKLPHLLALAVLAGAFLYACAPLENYSERGHRGRWEKRHHRLHGSMAKATQDPMVVNEKPQVDAPVETPIDPQVDTMLETPVEPTLDVAEEPLVEDPTRRMTYQAIPTGKISTSELLLIRDLPRAIDRGQTFEYTLTVKNRSERALTGVSLEERLPETIGLVGSDPTVDVFTGNSARWGLGTLEPGAAVTVTISAVARGDGALVSQAQVRYDSPLEGVFQVVSPALSLELSSPESTVPGENFEVQVTVHNSGSGSARHVDVSAALPEGLVTEEGSNGAQWILEELPPGASETLTFTARAERSGSFASTAEASMGASETVSATGGSILVQDTRLAVAISGPTKFYLGQAGKLLVTVKNVGGAIARDVRLEQALPAGVSLQRASSPAEQTDNVLAWSLGDLEPGTETAITLYLMPSQTGSLDLVASAQADTGMAAEGNYSAPMEGISALTFTIEDLQDPVPVGESLTYLVKVENKGTAPGEDILVVVTMDEGMQLVHAKGPTNGRTDGNKILFNPLESLKPGATATWQLVLQSDRIGDLRLGAALTSKRLERPVEVTESTQFYQ